MKRPQLLTLIALAVGPALAEDNASPGRLTAPLARLHCIDPKTPEGLRDLFKHSGEPLPLVSAHRGGAAKGFPGKCIPTFEETLTAFACYPASDLR